MSLPFELHIALRYLLAKRRQAFISLVSFISMLGVGVGVLAVVVALAMMTGLQLELQNRIVGSNAHIYVWNTDGIGNYQSEAARLRALPHVIGAAPGILGQGLVSASRETLPIQIKGIDPALEPQVTDIRSGMTAGSLEALSTPAAGGVDGILLGKDLATKLGVTLGDSVSVLTPQGTLSPMGMIPRARRLQVVGVFSLRLYEFDSTFGYVSLNVARRLLDKDHVDFIQLRVDDIWSAPQVARAIPAELGKQYITEDWQSMQGTLFSALWLEKIAVTLAIGLIVMVAALNIVASLILLVMDKSRDIAILKTMGASVRSVTIIFMTQGLIIGVVGTTVGALLGVTISRVMDRFRLISMPADVYQVSYLPFTVLGLDVALVVSMAVLICFVATIYPSRQAAHLDPAQALRYE